MNTDDAIAKLTLELRELDKLVKNSFQHDINQSTLLKRHALVIDMIRNLTKYGHI